MLDDRLRDLGTSLAFPPTPPLVGLVREALARPAPRRFLLGRPLSRGLAVALLATILLAGIAAAFGFGIGGLRLTFGPASFSPLPSFVVGPGLGTPTSLDAARGDAGFSLRVPALAELGQPDAVYFVEPPAGGAVTFLYGERTGYPPDPSTGISLVVTQFRADIDPGYFEKMIDSGVSVTSTTVNGTAAWWIAGGNHFFFYRDANGRIVNTTLRLAGDTLIWEEGGVTHRVEGAPSLAKAILVAESLE
jgi:hypothetical protein